MFKKKSLVLYLFIFKLRVTFDSTLDYVNESSKVTGILLNKNLKLNPEQGFYLALMVIIVLIETDLYIKEKGGK